MVSYDLELMKRIRKSTGKRTPYSYLFSGNQNKIFYDLRRTYRWNKFNVEYMKRLIVFKKLSTYDAFKKVTIEKNYV